MTTEAEIAAGQLYHASIRSFAPLFGKEWDELPDGLKEMCTADAMDIVRAYQRAAWREPTAEEVRERKLMLTTNSYMRGNGEWSPWDEPRVDRTSMKSDEFDDIRVQDLPPLPEPKL